ncbi:hypothetical protein KFE25_010959 [Diacronema lutheri]|uniref:CS domain-containing protein n=1 Tax=Diacronema lutheri TaxID=2081491 RepID=A0A8J5XJR7_DIALT|nr:hypothetical protein KFE25_010959 [Diacronema lutheri]
MLTPRFTLDQDDAFVIVRISLPHAKLDEGEFDIDGCQFRFHLRPYFLRLTFRHALAEDGRERASYDWDSRLLTVHLPKAEPGVRFEGLQMLTELLAPPKGARLPPRIEVISSSPADALADAAAAPTAARAGRDDAAGDAEDGAEWEAVQSVEAAVGLEALATSRAGYGFNRAYSGVFARVPPSEAGMSCPSPDAPGAPDAARWAELRVQHECERYDDEHYTADLLGEDDEIVGLLDYQPWWHAAHTAAGGANACSSGAGGGDAIVLDGAELERLRALRRREHLLDKREAACALSSGLVDLLFATCYDWRVTLGDGSCESAWTVLALSATLSWLARFEGPPAREVCISCVRRSLVFPLYRHWRLALAVLSDVAAVLELGAPAVVRCLLRLQALLQRADGDAHLLDDIFVSDFISWVQQGRGPASPHGLRELAARVRAADVRPSDLPAHFCAMSALDRARAGGASGDETTSSGDEGGTESGSNGASSSSDGAAPHRSAANGDGEGEKEGDGDGKKEGDGDGKKEGDGDGKKEGDGDGKKEGDGVAAMRRPADADGALAFAKLVAAGASTGTVEPNTITRMGTMQFS